jgi:hypothetical protein
MPRGGWNRGTKGMGICKPNFGSFVKGQTGYWKGKSLSLETRQKISNSTRIAMSSNEVQAKLRKPHGPMSEEGRKNISLSLTGNPNVSAAQKKRFETQEPWNKGKIGVQTAWNKGMCGEQSHAWKGGISFEPYSCEFSDDVKNTIRKRDNYECQLCGVKEEGHLLIYNGQSLPIHHIDYNKKNSNPKNLITLCHQCHAKTSFDREYWVKSLSERVKFTYENQ